MQITTTTAQADIEKPSMCRTNGSLTASGIRSGTRIDVSAIVNNKKISGTIRAIGQKGLFCHFVSFHNRNAPGQMDNNNIRYRPKKSKVSNIGNLRRKSAFQTAN